MTFGWDELYAFSFNVTAQGKIKIEPTIVLPANIEINKYSINKNIDQMRVYVSCSCHI